jgi:2,3-bisphosphoglycerate-independent phosphoglycerate mutase
MKALLVVADGLGGRPTDYQGKTCLEAARTPHLDDLARRGITGLLDPIRPGVRPGSDTAHLSLFGYDPYRYYPGRGVFEAVGVGLDVKPSDVCFRTNFATVDEGFIVRDRRAGRIESGQAELEAALRDLKLPRFPDVTILFKASTEHRGALILRGPNLSAAITDADPHEVGLPLAPVRPTEETEAARRTAEIVNDIIRQSYELLKDVPLNRERERQSQPPANVLLPRGAAAMPRLPQLQLPGLYGIKGVVIAGGALYIGVGRLLGLEYKAAAGVTGGLDSPIINKAKRAVEELQRGADLVFLHVKGSDTAGHDHDAAGKIAFIEKIDAMMGYLDEQLDWQETHLAFTGDHCTPVVYGDHTSEPVPLLIVGPNVLPDAVKQFDERSVMSGGLGRVSGNVVPMLAGYSNWLTKFGA